MVIEISGSMICSITLMEMLFNPCGEFWVRRAQLAKFTLLTPCWCPWDPFKSFKVCLDAKERERERERGVRKAKGSYYTYSIPGKTAAWIPEFAVEDLPSAELQSRFLRLQ